MKKIYCIRMMSGQKIPLESREELDALMAAANGGARLVMTKYGVVNLSSIDSITLHKELMDEVAEKIRFGENEESARSKILGNGFSEEQKKLS
jgi:hypothetical protein